MSWESHTLRKPRIFIWRGFMKRETSILGEIRIGLLSQLSITGLLKRTWQATMRQQMRNTHASLACRVTLLILSFSKVPWTWDLLGQHQQCSFQTHYFPTSQFKYAEERSRYSRSFSLQFKTPCEGTREKAKITGSSCSMTLNGKANLKSHLSGKALFGQLWRLRLSRAN